MNNTIALDRDRALSVLIESANNAAYNFINWRTRYENIQRIKAAHKRVSKAITAECDTYFKCYQTAHNSLLSMLKLFSGEFSTINDITVDALVRALAAGNSLKDDAITRDVVEMFLADWNVLTGAQK